jgi:hypothetical protein
MSGYFGQKLIQVNEEVYASVDEQELKIKCRITVQIKKGF